MLKYRPVEITPKIGGKLVTTISSEKAGAANYVEIRDWRRYIDEHLAREGFDYFWPNTADDFETNPGAQPFPNDATIASVASLVRSGVTATVTIDDGHVFVEGELVKVSGASQTAYNGTFTIFDVTETEFSYTLSSSPVSPATGTITVKSAMPINLVHHARRPNGKDAVIVGTAARLFRFFALDNGEYYETTGDDTPYFETSGSYTPYFEDNPGEWIVIGTGYSLNGNRWEAESIDGYSIFNNGVDLPMTYRIEESEVVPIYELRENGVAAVGTIKEYNGILMLGDVSQIQSDAMQELFQPVGVEDSGSVIASQSTTTITASSPIFEVGDIHRWVVFDSGESARITGFTSGSVVIVETSQTVTNQAFKFRIKGAMVGSYYSGSITATYNNGTKKVTAASGTEIPVAGNVVRFTNGLSGVVAASPSPSATEFYTVSALGESITSALPYWIIDESTDYVFTSAWPIFTEDMVGETLLMDSGDSRTITEFINSTSVTVDSDFPIASDFFSVSKPDIYGRFDNAAFIDRIQYRLIWSMPNLPRRFAAVVRGSITAGSIRLVLESQAFSFESGDTILVQGAGVSGGNLTANIVYIAGNRFIMLDTPAVTTMSGEFVQQLDSVGSIVGYYDLQDDSSAIVKMLPLAKALVVYKDTSIFIGGYTGLVATPFAFGDAIEVTNGGSLFYRNTLVDVNSQYHIYAGANSFWRFDLTNQLPQVFEPAELCKNIFFDQATLAESENIWAANNSNTKEIYFVFPSSSSDKLLAFDYLSGEFTTSAMVINAGSMVRKPKSGITVGPSDKWFVMAVGGTVVVYGLANEPVDAWDGEIAIFYRRYSNPFTTAKTGYDATQKSGLCHFGTNRNEKAVRCFTPILSSLSADVDVDVWLYSGRNPGDTISILDGFPYNMTAPHTQNDINCAFQDIYFQQKLIANILYNQARLSGVIWDVAIMGTRDAARAPVAAP